MKLIIDADPIVYRAGFASETHHYHVVAEDKDGNIVEGYFQPKEVKKGKWKSAGDQMKAWLKDKTLLDKERVVFPEPVENALHLVRNEIEGIVYACDAKFKYSPEPFIYLTGPGNFREKIATIRPYKGNRDATHKPYHYQAIRNYLTGQWDAEVVSGYEADDACSIAAWHEYRDGFRGESYVVATIDKDLDQIPGMHYDYRQKVFYDISPYNAEMFFWQQVLSGDQTDNIPGCYKIGSERAKAVVQDVIDHAADQIWPTPTEFWARVLQEYTASQNKKGCPYEHHPTEQVALETARLVYMQQKPRELWVPPGCKPELTEEYND